MAREVEQVARGLFLWQHYEAEIKADLFSTGLVIGSAVYLIDPIPLSTKALEAAIGDARIEGVIVTNANHARAACAFAAEWEAPIYAHAEAQPELGSAAAKPLTDGGRIGDELTVVSIEGAAPGEVAIHWGRAGGTVVMGDALINFGSHGFGFLPAKYCSDPKRMRQALRKLLNFDFERLLFAHGNPIVSQARQRFADLLEVG